MLVSEQGRTGIVCAILCIDGFCYAGIQLCFHSKKIIKKKKKSRKGKKNNQVSACPDRAVSPGGLWSWKCSSSFSKSYLRTNSCLSQNFKFLSAALNFGYSSGVRGPWGGTGGLPAGVGLALLTSCSPTWEIVACE